MKKLTNRKIKLLFTFILVVLLIMSMVSCQMVGAGYRNFKEKFFPVEEDEESFKIAVFEPMSGAYSSNGTLEIRGIELANELYPSVLDTNIKLVYLDNKSDMYEGEEIVKKSLNDSFTAVIGSYGEVLTLVCGARIKEIQIPAISVSSTNTLVTLNNPYYFLTSYTDDTQGKTLAQYAYEEKSMKNFAVVRISADDTTSAIRDEFKEYVNSFSDTTFTEYDVTIDQVDFQSEIRKLMGSDVTSILLLLPENAAREFMAQARNLYYKPLFLGTREWDNDVMYSYLEQNELICAYCISEVQDYSTELGKQFIKAYKEKYDTEPTSIEAKAFDTYMILYKAIENAKAEYGSIDSDSIRKSISSMNMYEGASGIISFEDSNIAKKTITIECINGDDLETKIIDDVSASN